MGTGNGIRACVSALPIWYFSVSFFSLCVHLCHVPYSGVVYLYADFLVGSVGQDWQHSMPVGQ